MERSRIIKIALSSILLLLLYSCKDFSKAESTDNHFEGVWSSTIIDKKSEIASIYIKRENEDIFDCYFISSSGNEIAYKAIYENQMLKIGNDYTIKYLEDSKQLYIVERSIPLKPTKDFYQTLKEFRKSLVDKGNNGAYGFIYFPFEDSFAKLMNRESRKGQGISDYSMSESTYNVEKIETIFSTNNINCLVSSEVVSYNDIENNQFIMESMGNYLRPYEYVIQCHDQERPFFFLFSLREGEYKLSKLLYQP